MVSLKDKKFDSKLKAASQAVNSIQDTKPSKFDKKLDSASTLYSRIDS